MIKPIFLINTTMADVEIVTRNIDSCNNCEKSFSFESELKIHYKIHTGSKPFKCIISQKNFSQASHLKTHELTHTGVKTLNTSLVRRNSLRLVT